eukprot:SAG11_NODE_22914_length_398_cov_0.695652_1_plen_87_part_00
MTNKLYGVAVRAQAMNLVDFFAVAPAYIGLLLGPGANFAVLRILRLARIFRVVKVGSFKENLDLVVEALRRSRSGLLLMGEVLNLP